MGDLFAADPRIARVHELRNRRLPLPFNRDKATIVKASRHHPYDYVINLELGPLFNDLVRTVSARHRIGMPYHYFAEPPEAHAVENLKLIYQSFLGSQSLNRSWPVLQGLEETALRKRFNLPSAWHVFVPANSHVGKRHHLNHRAWPLSHWQNLLELCDVAGIHIVMVGGPADRSLLDALRPLPDTVTDLIGRTRFSELVGLIRAARSVVTTDTGPAHIAGAVNTPVTVLIGPTNPKRTAPYSTPHNTIRVISAGLPCSPCYHTPRLSACSDNRCMQQINPEQVFSELASFS